MNKKADLAVTLLVFLVVLVSIITLFSFFMSSGVDEKIYDASVVEGVYAKENIVEFYVWQIGEEVLKESHSELRASSGNLNNNLVNKFNVKFNDELQKYNFEDGVFEDLKSKVVSEEFDSEFDGKVLSVKIQNFNFDDSLENIEVKYTADVVVELDLEELGLEIF